MKRILILTIVCLIALTACGNKVEIKDFTKGFKDADLNVNDEREMTREDYGAAPMKAEKGIIFGVEKGQDGQYMNGRLLEFKDEKDLDQTKEYYDKLGEESAILYSHTYKTEDGKYLLQMNGEVADSTFNKYKDTMIKVLNGEKVERLATSDKAGSKDSNNNTEEFQSSNVVDSSVSESLTDSNPQQINNTENTQQNQQEESGQQITKQQIPVNNSNQSNSEQLPTNGIGGHPSLYDPSIPPPSEDNLKTDENGDVYYDATNE
ncbi:hypothetical protein [Staphylococcus chromogenes]|uniref:hypothetical protein n=1 Tax=Staphylococcus chromogenes TaxID=46126 RepID=UPI0020CF7B43|nr:hypothetical protein [Staphylococcus chromogenes]